MTDEKLITAFMRGKEGAFEDLMAKYQRPLFYMVRGMVFDVEEARDITQKAFIKAFRRLKSLKNRSQFRGWLYRIAANQALDYLKIRKENLEYEGWMVPDCRTGPEPNLIRKDLKKQIMEAINCLPPRQHQVLNLRLISDLSFREISEILEIKQETARSNFHFAMKGLRELLRKREIIHEM